MAAIEHTIDGNRGGKQRDGAEGTPSQSKPHGDTALVAEDSQDTESGANFLSEEECARLRDQLERAVTRLCPRWLADRRDDLVQVALMRVMEIQRRSEGKRQFAASYLWKVAYSAMVDEIRRLRRRKEDPLEDEAWEGGPAAPSPGPDRRAADREIALGIRQCLDRLVRPRRMAVVLYLQGHSVPEASKLLNWGNKRTENLVYRGLADLRGCLAARGLEP